MPSTIEKLYQQELGRAPDPVGMEYWSNLLSSGMSEQDLANAIALSPEGRIYDAYNSQLGRAPEDAGRDYWLDQATNQGVSIEDVIQGINSSLEGQNYDTQAITAAYRDSLARNPEQEGYQAWLSGMQSDPNFGTSELAQAIANSIEAQTAVRSNAINSASLEADPYSGRYATRSIYDLLPDAVNVSSINGRDAQFVTPVTQMPVVSNYSNGQFSARQGDYTFNPEQFASQVDTAARSGALTPDQYTQLMNGAQDATSVEEFLAAMNGPQATVNIGAGGAQTGVNGVNVDFGPIIQKAYSGVDTGTGQTNVLNNSNFEQNAPGLFNNAVKQLQSRNSGFGQVTQSAPFQSFGTFGASDGTKVGAGNANYNSDLIKSLRETNQPDKYSNKGFTRYGYGSPESVFNYDPTVANPNPGAFNPGVLTQDAASADDVANWNDYSSYRTNALNAKTPIISFSKWLSEGKSDGKPVDQAIDPNVYYSWSSDGGGA